MIFLVVLLYFLGRDLSIYPELKLVPEIQNYKSSFNPISEQWLYQNRIRADVHVPSSFYHQPQYSDIEIAVGCNFSEVRST